MTFTLAFDLEMTLRSRSTPYGMLGLQGSPCLQSQFIALLFENIQNIGIYTFPCFYLLLSFKRLPWQPDTYPGEPTSIFLYLRVPPRYLGRWLAFFSKVPLNPLRGPTTTSELKKKLGYSQILPTSNSSGWPYEPKDCTIV